jgi:hypothetical protein
MFHLARGVKSHPATASLDPLSAWELTCDVVDQHAIELPELGADLFEEDGSVDFVSKWEKIRFPFGADPVALAFEAAGDGGLATEHRRAGRYQLFLTVAGLLQLEMGSRPILLPVHVLKRHFGCEPKTVSAWIGWAKQDGVLRKVRDHVFHPGGRGRAAEYVFGLHRWDRPTLEELATRLDQSLQSQDVAWTEAMFAEGGAP